MNDRFKFRAWDKTYKKIDYETLPGNILQSFYENDLSWEDKSGFILMQCTGLKDKNGKLIFEGDILKESFELYSEPDLFIVLFLEGCYFIKRPAFPTNTYPYLRGKNSYLEIIGNIYEHPDLLK